MVAPLVSLDLALLDNAGFDDLDLFQRLVLRVGLHQAHSLDDLKAAFDSSKDRVLPVKPGSRCQCDEELTSIRIRSAVCHAQNAGTGVLQPRMNLIFELFTKDRCAASASSGRIAALDHEVWDDPMEHDTVVVPALCQR